MEDAKIDFNIPIVNNDASDLSHTIEQLRTIDDILGDIYIKVQMINNVR